MSGSPLAGLLDTQANFILAAAGVCVMTAFTLVLLTKNTDIATQRQKIFAAVWTAVVAGVGVWTTHFVAMIGYRPDAALSYDFQVTLISILVGVAFVGIPVGVSLFLTGFHARVGLGILAGLGVAAMHLTGMSAIQNCLATYDPLVLIFGIRLGITGFVWAMIQDETDPCTGLSRMLGVVGGVCALHFVAMASVTLDRVEVEVMGIGGSFLSILVAVVSLGVFAFAMVATFNHRRTLPMARAGY